MSCENSSRDQTLAKEYKYLLSKIRPLIEQLDKSKDAQLCLLWLSKLDQCSRWEECERNEILCELSRQVKNKSLEPPFNSQPPPGPLKNILLHNSIPLWKNNDFYDDMSSEMTSPRSPISSFSVFSCGSEGCQTPVMSWVEKTQNSSKIVKEDHSRCLALQEKYHERLANDQLLITRYHEIIKSLITQKFKDPAALKLKTLKSTYETKISELTTSLREAEEENACLRKKLSNGVASVEKLQETESRIDQLQEQIKRLEMENSTLDMKCRDLETEKSRCLVEMTEKLNETKKKLEENDHFIQHMEKKYEESFWESKNQHEKKMSEMEKKYACELSALERILEEKQNEISRLVEQVSTQSLNFEEQVLKLKQDLLGSHDLEKEKRKVKFLKGKLKKVRKHQENMTFAFQSQLEQLLAKKDQLISVLEMKVKSSDVDTSGNSLYPGFGDVMSEKVRILEMQYRILLEEAENQATQRRQLDLQKILVLEKQLVDNGVRVEDESCVSDSQIHP